MHARPRTPLQAAAALAGRQRSLLTASQARECGLSRSQLVHLTAYCGWERPARGLYALPGSTPSRKRDALGAVLLGGAGAVSSHLTAAALWGWCGFPLLPHIIVPRASSARTPAAKVHRSGVPAVDRATRQGIRCTSASRTLVDCAAVVERPRFELFVDDALCSGVASPESVRQAAERAGRKGRAGMAMLDDVLEVWVEDIRPDTPAEMRLLRRLLDLGAPAVTQHEVHDEAGRFVARLDAALPERRHGFEYDSDRWHNPRGWARDEARYAKLAALGWTIDPVCKLDLLPSSTRLAELLERAPPYAEIAPLATA